jgi:hypothetical protein
MGLEQQVQGGQECKGFQRLLVKMIFWGKSVGKEHKLLSVSYWDFLKSFRGERVRCHFGRSINFVGSRG